MRIVTTAMLYRYDMGEAAKKFSHDFAGWMMIVLAAGLFALVLWYLRHAFREVEEVDVGEVVRTRRRPSDRSNNGGEGKSSVTKGG